MKENVSGCFFSEHSVVTLVHRYFSTKLQVSMAFLHACSRKPDARDGRTDGLRATLNAPPQGGPAHNKQIDTL